MAGRSSLKVHDGKQTRLSKEGMVEAREALYRYGQKIKNSQLKKQKECAAHSGKDERNNRVVCAIGLLRGEYSVLVASYIRIKMLPRKVHDHSFSVAWLVSHSIEDCGWI